MKRIRKTGFLLGLALLILCVPVRAAELPKDLKDALPREAGKLLEDVDEWNADSLTDGLSSLWTHIQEDIGTLLRRQTKSVTPVLLAALLCGFADGLVKSAGADRRFLTMVGALTITVLTSGSLDSLMGCGTEAVEQMNTFSRALLPALAAVSAVSGGAVSATVRQVATVFFADLLLEAVHGLLIPMLYLYTGMLTAGVGLGDRRLQSVAELIKTVCTRLLTGLLLVFTLYLTVSGIFSASVDSTRVRVTKTAISGVVPVVGGIIAEASETVLAGAGLLKGSIGMFGMLGVLTLCVYPFLQLGIQYLLYKLTAFLTSVAGSPELYSLINGLGGAFGLILGMVGSCALVLLVSVLASVAVVAG